MEDSGFIGDPQRIRVLEGVPEALKLLAAAGLARVVVTNQSGVARGYFDEPDVVRVNRALQERLERDGAGIEAFYYCSHLEGCDCRKPLPGMVRRAVEEGALDLERVTVPIRGTQDRTWLRNNYAIHKTIINPRPPRP